MTIRPRGRSPSSKLQVQVPVAFSIASALFFLDKWRHQFLDQFSSLKRLALAFHKNACLSVCALLRRIVGDDPVAVYDLLEVVLCATAVICLASQH